MKILIACIGVLFSFSLCAQQADPLVVVNGNPIQPGKDILERISIDEIESLTTFTSSDAIAKYGEFLGSNGMILITTKSGGALSFHTPLEWRLTYDDKKPVVVIDGRIVKYDTMDDVSPESIAKIEVMKEGIALVEKYGPRALNGVVIVSSK